MWFKNLLNLRISFAFTSRNIPVCNAKIVRGGKGMPWNDRVAVHPLPDGTVEVTSVTPAKSLPGSDLRLLEPGDRGGGR
jgi:hypothetical protein